MTDTVAYGGNIMCLMEENITLHAIPSIPDDPPFSRFCVGCPPPVHTCTTRNGIANVTTYIYIYITLKCTPLKYIYMYEPPRRNRLI